MNYKIIKMVLIISFTSILCVACATVYDPEPEFDEPLEDEVVVAPDYVPGFGIGGFSGPGFGPGGFFGGGVGVFEEEE